MVHADMRLAMWIPIAALFASLPFLGLPKEMLPLLILILMFCALATSWNILAGYAGYISFGQAGFFGIGAYVTAMPLYYQGVNPFLMVPLAGVASASLAFVVGYPCLKLRGAYFAIVTMALAFILQLIVWNVPWTGGGVGLPLPMLTASETFVEPIVAYYLAMLGVTLAALIVSQAVENSKFGYGLIAIRESEEVAESAGVPTLKFKILAFMLSTFFAGMVGGIWAPWVAYVQPIGAFPIFVSIYSVVMSVVGGIGTWIGPMLGAIIMTWLQQYLLTNVRIAGIDNIIFGAILILVVITMPNGVIAPVRKLVSSLGAIVRRVGSRKGSSD